MPDRVDRGVERASIDRGATGEKVAASDPAAAPLETDAEAGGRATPWSQTRRALDRLMRETAFRPRPDTFGAHIRPGSDRQRRLGRTLFAFVVLLALLGIAAGLLGLA